MAGWWIAAGLKVELGLFEEEEENELTSDQPGSLLKVTEEMLRIKHRWRYDFSSLAACFGNVALTNNKTRTKEDVKYSVKIDTHISFAALAATQQRETMENHYCSAKHKCSFGPKATPFPSFFEASDPTLTGHNTGRGQQPTLEQPLV